MKRKRRGDRNSLKKTLKVLRHEEGGKERGRKKVKANSLKTLGTHLGVGEHTSGANAHVQYHSHKRQFT